MSLKFDELKSSKATRVLLEKQEERLIENRSKEFALPYIDLTRTSIETDALQLIVEKRAKEAEMAVFQAVGGTIHVGIHSPANPLANEILLELEKNYDIQLYLISTKSLNRAWDLYKDLHFTERAAGSLVDIRPEALEDIASKVHAYADVRRLFLEAQSGDDLGVSVLLEIIFGSAISLGVSDLHFEPQEDLVRLRYREDGVLHDILTMSHDIYRRMSSRMKILSEMMLTQVEDAQDGRFTIEYKDVNVEVRVSSVPSAYGESFVMRLLDPSNLNVKLSQLGIEPKLLKTLMHEARKPNGMIVITGPTGSGKTTTLYSLLKYIYNPEIKILTIENPIEYHLEGISQTQINHKEGYDFLSGLRAALRQDPDVIMVGEIRDPETASVAINASLTGHIVLATLHTNNAAGTFPRFFDLEIETDILTNAVTVSLAQRLVRKVCKKCSESRSATKEEKQRILEVLDAAERDGKSLGELEGAWREAITIPVPKGCEACNKTGYKGRIGIFEAILMNEEIEVLLVDRPSEREIWRASRSQAILNMAEDGYIKILAGITTLEEVESVVDIDLYMSLLQKKEKEMSIPARPNIRAVESHMKNVHGRHDLASEDYSFSHKKNQDPSLTQLQKKELTLLLEYLKTLELHQAKTPTVGIAEKIFLAKKSLVELMQAFPASELFSQAHNDKAPQKTLQGAKERLQNLETHQTSYPNESIREPLSEVVQSLSRMKKTL